LLIEFCPTIVAFQIVKLISVPVVVSYPFADQLTQTLLLPEPTSDQSISNAPSLTETPGEFLLLSSAGPKVPPTPPSVNVGKGD
jgi:hypothetical protein